MAKPLRQIIAADNARNIQRVMRYYTDDVVWAPPDREPINGAEAIRASYVKMYAETRPALAVTVKDVYLGLNEAAVNGHVSGVMKPAQPDAEERQVEDNFLAKLVCRDRRWLVSRLQWGIE